MANNDNDNKKKEDKIVKVSFNGLALYESGKVEKSDYFDFIKHNLDDYSDITFTAEEASKFQKYLHKLSTGSYSMVPLVCAGPACPFANRCPLQQMGKAPITKTCIIEEQLMNRWVMQYMTEYDVDPNNFTEVGYCNELAEIEILLMRLNSSISKPEHASLVIDQAVGFDREGTPIIQKQLSPFMEQKEKLQNRRSKIIKLMVGDRQEQYKKESALKMKLDKDPSSKMADTHKKLEALQNNLNNLEKGLPAANKDGEIKQLERVLTPEAIIAAADDQ